MFRGRTKVNLNEISHNSAIGLVRTVIDMGVLLTEVKLYLSEFGLLLLSSLALKFTLLLGKVYVDTVGDAQKYQNKLSEIFPAVKFVVAKKADSLYPVVSGASIVAKVSIVVFIFFIDLMKVKISLARFESLIFKG